MDSLEQAVLDLLRRGDGPPLRLLMRYGSRATGRDMDLLAVFSTEPPRSECVAGGLDLFAISEVQAKVYAQMFDPVITEPLLTGDVIFGSEQLARALRELLQDPQPSPGVIRHLAQRSLQSYGNCLAYLSRAGGAHHSRIVLLNLTYAVSYFAYARHYIRKGGPAIELSKLVGMMQEPLSHLWNAIADLKRAPARVAPETIEGLVQEFEAHLLR